MWHEFDGTGLCQFLTALFQFYKYPCKKQLIMLYCIKIALILQLGDDVNSTHFPKHRFPSEIDNRLTSGAE